jgi:superfamily II helicase
MEFICRHCNEVSEGDAYRVVSEEDGITLLDIIVCFECAMEARGLELSTQKIDVQSERMNQARFH